MKHGVSLVAVTVLLALALELRLCDQHGVMPDDAAHVAAALHLHDTGMPALYEVNSPLIAWMTGWIAGSESLSPDWSAYRVGAGHRDEFRAGNDWYALNREQADKVIVRSRVVVLVFFVLMLIIAACWARLIAGDSAALASVMLCAFTPDMMAWSASLCADVAGAATGLLAFFAIRWWVLGPSMQRAFFAGGLGGIAILAKLLWFVFPVIWLVSAVFARRRSFRQLSLHFVFGIVTAGFVINLGYGFHGTGTCVRDFEFRSDLFNRVISNREPSRSPAHERLAIGDSSTEAAAWQNQSLALVPVPLPVSLVIGLDLQRHDIELGKWCYLRGDHKFRGWWYWYAYALLVKLPMGTILLFVIASGWVLWRIEWKQIAKQLSPGRFRLKPLFRRASHATKESSPTWWAFEDAMLLVPAAGIFLLISSQTGFTIYLRYVLPCYPFVFIWISQLFSRRSGLPGWLRKLCWGLLGWSVLSSLSVYPHSMSYFNELVGGPENGPAHLIDASIDCGQDVPALREWIRAHPMAWPLGVSVRHSVAHSDSGLPSRLCQRDPRFALDGHPKGATVGGLEPGWCAVSVNRLYSRTREFAYLFDFQRTDMIGYSIYIYHLSQQEVDKWNREHGFEEMAETRDQSE